MKLAFPFLFYGIPENFLLILAALGLLGIRVKISRLCWCGLILSLISFIARVYLLRYMLHTPAIILGLILILMLGFRLSLSTALTGSFLGFMLLVMGEIFISMPLMFVLKIPAKVALASPIHRIAAGWVSTIFLWAAVVLCYGRGWSLLKAPDTSKVPAKHGHKPDGGS